MGGERRHGSAVMGAGSKAVAAPVAGRWQLHDLSMAGAVMGAKGSAGGFSPFERRIGRASVCRLDRGPLDLCGFGASKLSAPVSLQ